MKNLRLIQTTALACTLGLLPPAIASADQVEPIDIPAQPLADAITELGTETGLRVVANANTVAGKQSATVRGPMTPTEALRQMLIGTGLSVRNVGDDGAVVLMNFVSQNATNEPFELDAIVISLDRFPTTTADLASSTTILEAEDLQEQPSLEDNPLDGLARVVPGIQPGSSFGSQPTIRGRDPAVRVNGVDILSRSLPSRGDIFGLAGGSFGRLEVVRGADATFGQGASGGSINFITPSPVPGEIQQEATFGLSFAADGDGPDRATERLRYSSTGTIGETDFYFGTGLTSFGTQFDPNGDPIADDTGLPTRNTDQVDLNFTLERDLGGTSSISTNHYLNYNFTDERTFLVQRDADPVNDVGSTALPNPGTVDTESDRLDYVGTLTYSNTDFLGSEAQITPFAQYQEADEFITGLRSERQHGKLGFNSSFRTFVGAGTELIWGLDYEYSFGDDQVIEGFGQSGPLQPGLDIHNISPFVQIRAPLTDRLTFDGGVRYEYFDVEINSAAGRVFGQPDFTGGSLSYDQALFNASLTYEVFDRVEVYGAFSQALDVLDIGGALSDRNFTSASQLDPDPSATNQFEVGARGSQDGLQWTAAVFYSDSDAASGFIVVPDAGFPNGFGVRQVRERRELYGVEATLDWQVNDQLALGGYVAFTDGDFENSAGEMVPIRWSDALPLTIAPYVEYQATDRLFMKAQVLHQVSTGGGRTDSAGNVLNGTDSTTFVDLFARYELDSGVINFGIENAFDEFVISPFFVEENLNRAVPQEGRRFSVSYTHQW